MNEAFEAKKANAPEGKIEGPIDSEQVQWLKQPTYRLVKQLLPELRKGSYQMIIGDDASGRLPTLLFGRVARSIAEEAGKAAPTVHFFAGSRFYGTFHPAEDPRWKDKKDEMMRELRGLDAQRKVLLVTDMVETGASLLPLAEVLDTLHIQRDIAAISFFDQEKQGKEKIERLLKGRVYIGDKKGALPSVYEKTDIAGVVKEAVNVHSDVVRKPEVNVAKSRAREDIVLLAQRIYDRL